MILQGFKHFFTLSADYPDGHGTYLLPTRLLKKTLKVLLKAVFGVDAAQIPGDVRRGVHLAQRILMRDDKNWRRSLCGANPFHANTATKKRYSPR